MTLKTVLDTVYKIVKSRFTKDVESEESARKKAICKKCEFNTLNVDRLAFKKRIIKKLSDFYSKITGNAEKDILGGCSACGCSVYYKILFSNSSKDCPKNKW